MVLTRADGGAQPHQSAYRAKVLTRTTGGAHRSEYSWLVAPFSVGVSGPIFIRR